MLSQNQAVIEAVLAQVKDPVLKRDLLGLGCLRSSEINGTALSLKLELGYPLERYRWSLEQQLQHSFEQCKKDSDISELQIELTWRAPKTLPDNQQGLDGIANVVAIASGKGGVGKSTTTVNLALALASQGAKVGILDADIYGPSQTHMLGITGQRPEVVGQKLIKPIEKYGLVAVSMGNLVNDNTPMVWRGPMAAGALQQLLMQTAWPELDYLLIDMPPGTGDIQLSLSQKVALSGAVIVTTPQKVALLDAVKGIEMFNKVKVPVLGVIENMASHVCSKCGHEEALFGTGGGEQVSQQYHTELLASLPLEPAIGIDVDRGVPSLVSQPDSPSSALYQEAAAKMAAQLWLRAELGDKGPELVFSND